jgi:ABC-type amino acid transport substrate-binding protein
MPRPSPAALTRRAFAATCGIGLAAVAAADVISTRCSAQTGGATRPMALTLKPGTLVVASAYPDPPFDLIENGSASGFDIELMRAISAQLGVVLEPVRYSGDDFNGIFDDLAKRSYDAVISGTTITPERSAIVLFSQPYLEFNQGVAVNRRLTPGVSSVAGLRGLTVASSPATPPISSPSGCWPKARSQASSTIPMTASASRSTISRLDASAW